jgi:hypothetical protein
MTDRGLFRDPAGTGPVHHHAEPRSHPDDRHIAAAIGAQHPCAGRGQTREHRLARVAIVVARTDTDQRDPRPHEVQELLILIRRAMMGHLEHVGTQQRRIRRGDELLLLLDLRVAREQDAHAVRVRAQDQ